MEIQIILDPRLSAGDFQRLGALAERAGIGAVWTSSLPGARDPFVNLSLLAATTTHLSVGAIAVNPFDTHPAKLLASLLTLNEIAAGRAAMVLGGGGEALAALGLAPARRVLAVREAATIMRRVLTDPAARYEFNGDVFRVVGFSAPWATASKPSLWIAANAPQMLRMAAGLGADIMMSDMTPALVRAAIAQYREQASAATSRRFSNFVAWHVYDDLSKARAEARQWLAFRGMFRRWVCRSFMSDADYDLLESKQADFYRAATGGPPVSGVPEHLIDALIDNLTITGCTQNLQLSIGHLQALSAAGLTHVALRLYQDVERSIELLGRDIIPALQAV